MSPQYDQDIYDLFLDVKANVIKTDAEYQQLYKEENMTNNFIPFFGRLDEAEIITIASSPSSDEFRQSRRWPDQNNADEFFKRCYNYFTFEEVHRRPHSWFDLLIQAFQNESDYGYSSGTVAHLDLSPRTVKNNGEIINEKNCDLFRNMIIHDFDYLKQFILLCNNIKVLIFMGSTPAGNGYSEYIHNFFRKKSDSLMIEISDIKSLDEKEKDIFEKNIRFENIDKKCYFLNRSPGARPHLKNQEYFSNAIRKIMHELEENHNL